MRGLHERDKGSRVINFAETGNYILFWETKLIKKKETKLEHLFCSLVRCLWGCQYVDLCCLDSRGASGGIVLMWDRWVVKKIEGCGGEFTVACSAKNILDQFS